MTVSNLSTKMEITEIQRVIADLGAHDVIFSILATGLAKEDAEVGCENTLCKAKDARKLALFDACLTFLTLMCKENPLVQQHLVQHSKLILSFVNYVGLRVPDLVHSIAYNNLAIVTIRGKEWIRVFFHTLNR